MTSCEVESSFHSVANGSPLLQHYTGSCVALALWRGDGHC